MKLRIDELRQMVGEAVERTLSEAKRKGKQPKEIPQRSEDSIKAQRDRQVKALPGYAHSDANDYSEPLGDDNLYKRQGQSNMGGWTAEQVLRKVREMQLRKVIRAIVAEKVRLRGR